MYQVFSNTDQMYHKYTHTHTHTILHLIDMPPLPLPPTSQKFTVKMQKDS